MGCELKNALIDALAVGDFYGVADALLDAAQPREFKGPVNMHGLLESQDRGYADLAGANKLLPVPPVPAPKVLQGMLVINNPANGVDDPQHGNNGFGIWVKDGILRGSGENWLIKWAVVQSISSVADGKSSDLAGGIDTSHYYADCYECTDSKGRGVTTRPVRIFYLRENQLPKASDVVPYIRDQNGLAYGVGSASTGSRYALAQSNWEAGSTGPLVHAKVSVKFCDEDGTNAIGDAFDANLVESGGQNANVRSGEVILVQQASDGTWVAASDYLDGRIGDIKVWSGAYNDIQTGWALCDGSLVGAITVLNLKHKFIMGIDVGGQADENSVGTGASYGNRDHGNSTNDHTDHAAHNHTTPAHQHAVSDHTHADHPDHVHHISETSDVADGITNESWAEQYTAIQTKATDTIGDVLTLTHADKTGLTTDTDGGSTTGNNSAQSHSATDNRPPYYVLAYIQRVH